MSKGEEEKEEGFFSRTFGLFKKTEEEVYNKIFGKKVKEDEDDLFGVDKKEEQFVFDESTGFDVLSGKIAYSAQKSPWLDDFQKKQYLNPKFFYEVPPGETYWDFYKKMIYSVHPEIQEKKDMVDRLSWKEVMDLAKDYSIARRDYFIEKRKGQKQKDEDTNEEEFGSDIFGKKDDGKGNKDAQDQIKSFERGVKYPWIVHVPITNKQEIERVGRDFKVELYKDNLDDINPLFGKFPKHGSPYIDLTLDKLEKFSQWQTTRLLGVSFICIFPMLIGMVLARQVPMNLGGGDIFKVLKSKMVYKGGFSTDMTRREAGLVLGLKQNATKEEIRGRHRKLMISNHPDNGGSQYIAAKINEAKELMLKGDLK